ncbi:MAG: hypothetical protein JW986_03990 [Methanotrichaceae archaeon]|nr:hypothetical protein [Methanotrichaceae archaeon]
MTEVPELPLEEIQQRMVGVWIGNFYSSSGYVGRKLGKKGLREYYDLGARQVAGTFKHMGFSTPIQVALAIATNEANLFGSKIEVEEAEDGCAVLDREHCAILAGAKAFSRIGASLLAKEHCKICSESHWRRVFSEMGMGLEVEKSEDGCLMRVSPKKE